ncbi:MAG: helix-turn-helix transcriptional regulator [Acidaminococcaceae bacterium]|nr:helix-turn-helix transcriptional regulator [Acidaminococcaceae bacterium]
MIEINFTEMVKRIDIELLKKGVKRPALKEVGIPPSSLSNWATGKRTPSSMSVAQIADFLGVSIEFLLFGKERGGELTQEELSLLDNYRSLSVQSRAVVMTVVKGLRQ